MILKLFLNAFFVGLINSINNNKDEIINLPELKMKLSFKHYSGFLEVFPNTRFFHYWFVESQNNPSTDPLIFWFNGGPGCSSIDGLLNEMGPYIVEKDGKSLKNNPNSWTKYASIVYIESPAGVGYSYSKEKSITLNDDQTALDNYNAIKQFFSKFPDFKHHSVFIMGESYGGVYVPMLTKVIIDGLKDFNINLKGVAIGNGYVNKNLNIDTSIRFAYSHGLIDEQLWKKLEQHCCNGCIDDCTLYNLKKTCKSKINQIFNFIWSGGLNPYDLYQDCDVNSKNNSIKTHSVALGVMPSHQVSASLIKKKKKKTLKSSVPCLSDFDITTYMNDPKVRKAIHIPSNFQNWSICSEMVTINYEKQYDDMSRFILKILDQNVPVLLYYGDTDMACNFLLGQQFSEQLNLKRIEHKKAWKFNHQIAGFKTIYDKNLTFLTIRGAGHMAPQWKAPQMDYVISKFLKNDNI